MNRSLLRDIVGFSVGGLLASILSCVVFLIFFPLSPDKPTDHSREALAMLAFGSFLCGAFIGRRAFTADFVSQMLPSLSVSYSVMLLLCFLASLDFSEIARIIGVASAGILPSAAALFLLGQRIRAQSESDRL